MKQNKNITGGVRMAKVMKRSDRIIIVGNVWNSRQNGMVLDVRGICVCMTVGQHYGTEPKIRVVNETY